MAVLRVVRRPEANASKPPKAGAVRVSGPPELPSGLKAVETDPSRYVLLLYGREKIGKTVWLSSWPDSLFLTTEPGTKGLRIAEYNAEDGGCRTWELFRAAVDRLEKESSRFRTVVVDTVDRAYDLCLEYICSKLGIEHPGESADGKEDFGKSWKEVKKEFVGVIHRILQTGRGLAFTSHAKEEVFKSRSGERFSRIHPSMSGQARSVVEALVDLFFYAEYMRAPDGGSRRVIVTEGDEIVWAGHRRIATEDGSGIRLPRLIPMTETRGYDVFRAAFRGEDVGLNPATLLPSRSASEAVREFFRNVRRGGETEPEPATAKNVPVRKTTTT